MPVPVPKPPKRIRDRALMKAMREEIPYCEVCGRVGYGDLHHIRYRSQLGSDIRANLIRLCYEHHAAAHAGVLTKRELIEIVARREGKTVEEIAEEIGVVL